MDYINKNNRDTLLWAGFCGLFFFVPLATSPAAISGVFILVVWIFSGKCLDDMKNLLQSKIKIPLTMLAVLPWAGLTYTPVPEEGLAVALKTYHWLFTVALVSLLKPGVVHREGQRNVSADSIIKMFVCGLGLNSCISVLQLLGIVPLKRGIPAGLLGGDAAHIPYSLMLTAGILILSLYFNRAQSKKMKFLCSMMMIQFFVVMIVLGSRSGYIAFCLFSPLLVHNMIGGKHFIKIIIGSALIVAVVVASPVAQSRIAKAKEDLRHYKSGNVNTSLGLRLHMWEIALKEIKRSPLVGTGTAGFIRSWEDYKNNTSLPFFIHGNPHSNVLYILVSFGLVGLIPFCWMLFIMVQNGWRGRDSPLGFALLVFTLVFIIGGLVDTPLLSIPLSMSFSLFAGIAGAVPAQGET